VVDELHEYLQQYNVCSEQAANEHCDRFYLNHPVAYRAIAPTGTIGSIAATTTGIEPLYAVAYKRRYLTDGKKYKFEYVVDSVAEQLVQNGHDPDKIETCLDLAEDYERRIKFQADVQAYVDMGISSTINLPKWGSEGNNEQRVNEFAGTIAKYAPRLRGLTCYPDGARGGQPITRMPYDECIKHRNVVYEENSECIGGICGI
jgi:ribonucleoside-diphosphate reductase alpha chain